MKQGYRDTQRQLIEMSEKTAEVDQLKGATLEEISAFVEQIGREFKTKQMQLQPLMVELKVCVRYSAVCDATEIFTCDACLDQSLRQDYMELESRHEEAKSSYDKVAISLEMDKQALEKECDAFQVQACFMA